MNRFGEILSFSGVALGLHLGAWAWLSSGDVAGGGDAGDGAVTVTAASGEIADLVASWTAPVEVMTTPPVASSQDPVTAPEPAPVLETVALIPKDIAPMPALVPDVPAQSTPDAMPKVSRQTEAPPAPIAPMTPVNPPTDHSAPRPKARPETLTPPVAKSPASQPAEPGQKQPPKAASGATTKKAAAPAKGTAKGTTKDTAKSAAKPAAKGSGAKAQKAAGSGNGTKVGKQGTGDGSLTNAARQSLMGKWGAGIRQAIERKKRYPRGARGAGTVKLRVTIAPQGRLLGVSVVASSGNDALDQAAVQAVRQARLPKAPKGLTKSSYHFNLPIAFTRR